MLVTHDHNVAKAADRVAQVLDGRIVIGSMQSVPRPAVAGGA